MSNAEYTKSDLIEALCEILNRILRRIEEIQKNHENVEKGEGRKEEIQQNEKGKGEHEKNNIFDDELSEKAKELLNLFKGNPDLAKEIIYKFVVENIKYHSDRFNEYNSIALQEINNLKRQISLDSPNGKEILNTINLLEKLQMDKEQAVKNILSYIVRNEKTNEHEKENNQKEEMNERKENEKNKKEIELEIG
jgi:hypothetical protein